MLYAIFQKIKTFKNYDDKNCRKYCFVNNCNYIRKIISKTLVFSKNCNACLMLNNGSSRV